MKICSKDHLLKRNATTRHVAGALVTWLLGACLIAGCSSTDASDAEGYGPAGSEESTGHPSSIGLDSLRIALAMDSAAALPRLRSVVIARHGEILAERRFSGPGLDTPANVKSISKSILSALIGIAIEEGHLDGVDQPIAPFFGRYLDSDDDPRKQEITIGNLLTMQSGLEGTSGGNYGRWVTSPDWVRHVITRPMLSDPGRLRTYSTGNSHLLSAILTQATGQSTWAYARDRLAEPLGISLPRWSADPQGIFFGGNDMLLSPRDLFRFGELYRNGGRHGDKQIVPESWIRESIKRHSDGRRGEGYGYGWFSTNVRGHSMFYAWGYGGQFLFVIPRLEMTVVTTSDPDVGRERQHVQAIRRLLTDWIVPAAEVGGAAHRI